MRYITAICFLLIVLFGVALAADWPEFRGPTGQGHYTGKPLPLRWSPTANVAWKAAIPGKGWSSPVILKGRIYLTTAVLPANGKELSLEALCLDAMSGKQLWRKEVFRRDAAKAPKIHKKNSHASPTPIVAGQRLFVHFGHQGTACLDLNGEILWRNEDLVYAPVHGNGGSPILVDHRLIVSVDGADKQFVVALKAADGKIAWRTDRKSEAVKKFSFSTPLAIPSPAARGAGGEGEEKQIISPASDAVIAYDAADGKELWRVKYEGYSVIPRPVFGHGLLFVGTGYDFPTLLAIRPGGMGDVSESHIAWKLGKGAPHTPSPLLAGDELYLVSDGGIASCLDARAGKVHWQERIGGAFSASPLLAGDRIYLQSEEGVTTVIRAGKRFQRLARSDIKERTLASPAAVDGAIFLRTEAHLYRIQEK